jgi:hypothetical protein
MVPPEVEMNDEAKLAPGISVGNVRGTGIVIGHGSSAAVNQGLPREQYDAAKLLDEFLDLLQTHQNLVADAADVRQSVEVARAELADHSPRWHIVRVLLKGIAASVAGVSALAEAVNNIQTLISHISVK